MYTLHLCAAMSCSGFQFTARSASLSGHTVWCSQQEQRISVLTIEVLEDIETYACLASRWWCSLSTCFSTRLCNF